MPSYVAAERWTRPTLRADNLGYIIRLALPYERTINQEYPFRLLLKPTAILQLALDRTFPLRVSIELGK